jgi:hypothetical protein
MLVVLSLTDGGPWQAQLAVAAASAAGVWRAAYTLYFVRWTAYAHCALGSSRLCSVLQHSIV